MMKSVASFLLILALAAVVSGCGGKKQTPAAGPDLSGGEIGGSITVSCYDTMAYRNFLEEAARGFEALHPGTRVNIETFSSMPEIRTSGDGDVQMVMVTQQNDPQGRADYISRVNTSLMSGEGADIYAMDILPLHKLVEGGRLENLETYINGDAGFNRDDYRTNIIEALRYRDGIWIMPLDYTFDYFVYDSSIIPETEAAGFGIRKAWSGGELLKIGEKYFDGSAKIFNLMDYNNSPAGSLADRLLKDRIQTYADLENKKANFLDGGFAELLESVKHAGESGYVPKGVTGQRNAGPVMRRTAEEVTERYLFKEKGNIALFQYFNRGSGRRVVQAGEGAQTEGIEDDDEIAGIAANSGGKVPFAYTKGFGINGSSKNKTLAWAFIKYLLGEEIQLSTGFFINSLPLHNKAREQKAEMVFSGALMGREMPMDAALREGLEKYKAAVETLSDQINCFVLEDTILMDMIAAEEMYFFTGAKTAREAAAVLQNKADLYLNE
jgi:ABC-type glycerol-3-phosphate transport system substrate-binding protein